MTEAAPAVVAPDSFKGTLAATEVAAALARGLRSAGQDAVELPIGDGGEGTMDALLAARGGELRSAVVADPLGRPVDAAYGLLDDGRTAVVEMAQASGLWRVVEDERDALAATTRGTGELIAAAADAGAREVIVAVGGSATTDGGRGALEALDEAAVRVSMLVACDVRTPWEEAARVFGPQKGADPETVARLERRLDELARAAPRERGADDRLCGRALGRALGAPWRAPRARRRAGPRRGGLRCRDGRVALRRDR